MRRWFNRDRMEYWAFVAQIVGAVGVIASVIYLGVQLGGNTTALQAQTYYNAMTIAQRPFEILIADEDLAQIVETGEKDPDALSPAEWKVFCGFTVLEFNAWEYIYNLDKTSSVPTSLADTANAYYGDLVKTRPGVRRFWKEYSIAFVEPFLSHANAIVAEAEAAAQKE